MVVPISIGNWRESVLPVAQAAVEGLRAAGVRAGIDAREEATPGWKFAEYEMRGVPLRVEIGPRDVKAGQAVLVRRDTKAKETVPLAALASRSRLFSGSKPSCSPRPGTFLAANTATRRRLRPSRTSSRTRRLRPGPLVRRRGLRGQDQGRTDGHDPGRSLSAASTANGKGLLRLLRQGRRHWPLSPVCIDRRRRSAGGRWCRRRKVRWSPIREDERLRMVATQLEPGPRQRGPSLPPCPGPRPPLCPRDGSVAFPTPTNRSPSAWGRPSPNPISSPT